MTAAIPFSTHQLFLIIHGYVAIKDFSISKFIKVNRNHVFVKTGENNRVGLDSVIKNSTAVSIEYSYLPQELRPVFPEDGLLWPIECVTNWSKCNHFKLISDKQACSDKCAQFLRSILSGMSFYQMTIKTTKCSMRTFAQAKYNDITGSGFKGFIQAFISCKKEEKRELKIKAFEYYIANIFERKCLNPGNFTLKKEFENQIVIKDEDIPVNILNQIEEFEMQKNPLHMKLVIMFVHDASAKYFAQFFKQKNTKSYKVSFATLELKQFLKI